MKNTTMKEILRNRNLENGMINVVIDTLVNWNNQGIQGRIETDIYRVIEGTINSNIAEYFNDFGILFITSNFYSSENFLDNFYKANPEINIVVNEAIHDGVLPIQLILEGKRVEKSLDYYYKIFNYSLKTLQNLKN